MRVKAIHINRLKKNHPVVIILINIVQKCAKRNVAIIKRMDKILVLENVAIIPVRILYRTFQQLRQV